jgi:Zn-dependent protease with chaperone function
LTTFLGYLNLFHDYFSTSYVLVGLVAGLSLLSMLYVLSRLSRGTTKSIFLISISSVSTSLWIFVLSSFAFCMTFVQQYWVSPASTIFLVARLALLSSVILGASSMLWFRARALSTIYRSIREQSEDESIESSLNGSRMSKAFKELGLKIGQKGIQTVIATQPVVLSNESRLPLSLAFDWRKSKLVALRENVIGILDDDELEAVIGHELAHIKHRDALRKSIATAYRVAFPFDILARLVEAAVYRYGEFEADLFSAKITRRPISLASALLKIYENVQTKPLENAGRVSYLLNSKDAVGKPKGMSLFSKDPPIQVRIERLLEEERIDE